MGKRDIFGGPGAIPDRAAGGLLDAVKTVQGSDFVGLRHGREVEDGIDEIVDRAAEGDHGLADMNQIGGLLADDMHPVELLGLGAKHQLQHAVVVAGNLSPGQFVETGHPRLIWDSFGGKAFLGFPDDGDLRNGVDAIGEEGVQTGILDAKGGPRPAVPAPSKPTPTRGIR